jgi:inhibitor of cysteine peptidase
MRVVGQGRIERVGANRAARSLALVALLVLAVTLVGCQAQESVLTEEDDSATVNLRVGETLVVQLAGNPTTGFQWTENDPLPGVIEQRSSEYEQDPGSDDMVGAGGTYEFRYEAVEEGEGTLSLTYARPGESPEVDSTWSVTLRVQAAE